MQIYPKIRVNRKLPIFHQISQQILLAFRLCRRLVNEIHISRV